MTEPREIAEKLKELRAFLNGEAPLHGTWFGDRAEHLGALYGAFWWRHYLDPLDDAIATLLQEPPT